MGGAPLSNPFFRPEEKHVVSGENNVVPPPGRGNKAMKKPVAGWRTFQINLQIQRFTGLLAARMNLPRAMHGRRYAERVPGAISEILGVIDDYDMLGRHAGKRRSHPNGHSIGFQHQHTLSAQSNIGFANAARVGANTFSYNFQRRPLPGLGEVLINRQFRLRIKAHALSEVNREWSTFPVINFGADRGVGSDQLRKMRARQAKISCQSEGSIRCIRQQN